MPGKHAKVGVVAPGTPAPVKQLYEKLKEDPEARKFTREKGRHGLKGTLAAIAHTVAGGKGKKVKKKKKMEKSATHLLVKAALGGKYLRRISKPGGGYRYVYKEAKEKEAKEKGAKGQSHGVWASAVAAQITREIGLPALRGLREASRWVPALAHRIESLVTSGKMTREEVLRETRFSLGLSTTKKQKTKKSFTEENFMMSDVNIEELVKAARGGKYLKRVPKAGGGYNYVYHSEKHRVAHQAERMEQRAKQLHEQAKTFERKDMLASAGKARDKADLLMKLARRSRRGTGIKSSQPARAMKSIEALAIESATIAGGGAAAGEALAKAMVEVPTYGKTKKRNISDALLLKYLKAKIRTRYRDSVRWNNPSSVQAIYDELLSDAMHNPEIEAAMGLLEKMGIPFSTDLVKECIKEAKEYNGAETPAPTDTTRGSVAASGG